MANFITMDTLWERRLGFFSNHASSKSPCGVSLFYQRSPLVYRSPSALSGARKEWEGWREEDDAPEGGRRRGVVDKPSKQHHPPPSRRRLGLWLLLAPRHLAPFFNFLSLSLFCLLISLLKVFRRLPSASISTHLCLSAIITFQPSITPQPALINKHSESTPQHRTGLKMSPLCLCQYLSLCWRSRIRLRGGWLLQ